MPCYPLKYLNLLILGSFSNVFYYPILSNANEQVKNEGGEDELLGVLTITGFWRDFVTDILPPGSNGIIVVFQNDCGQQFSYQIWGPDSV
jgi:hypothetical protein